MWELDHKEGWSLNNRCFWVMVLEKTLENPLDSKIKPVNPKGSQPWILEGLMLKLQYSGHLMQTADSLEKTLILGKTEGKRRSRQQRMRWQDSITDSMDLRDREGQGSLDPSCSSNKGLWARFFKLPSYPGKPLALSQVCCPSGPPWSLLDPFTFTVLGSLSSYTFFQGHPTFKDGICRVCFFSFLHLLPFCCY